MMALNTASASTLLELTVHNHPRVLAQLTSLCSRRAYCIEGLLAPPAPQAAHRRVWLLLRAACAFEQLERQLLKLEDVHAVRRHAHMHPLLLENSAWTREP